MSDREASERAEGNRLDGLYEFELIHLCESVDVAARMLETECQRRPHDDARFWFAVSGFLDEAAGIARILWPRDKQRDDDQAARFRKRLGINDTGMEGARAVRNSLEHFDARLARWVDKNPDANILDRSVAPIGRLVNEDANVLFMRTFDPQTCTVHVRDEKVDLRALYSEIELIKGKVIEKMRNPSGKWTAPTSQSAT